MCNMILELVRFTMLHTFHTRTFSMNDFVAESGRQRHAFSTIYSIQPTPLSICIDVCQISRVQAAFCSSMNSFVSSTLFPNTNKCRRRRRRRWRRNKRRNLIISFGSHNSRDLRAHHVALSVLFIYYYYFLSSTWRSQISFPHKRE